RFWRSQNVRDRHSGSTPVDGIVRRSGGQIRVSQLSAGCVDVSGCADHRAKFLPQNVQWLVILNSVRTQPSGGALKGFLTTVKLDGTAFTNRCAAFHDK